LAPYRAEVWTPIVADLAGTQLPKAILAPVTSRQRELMARLAARLGVGLSAGSVALAAEGGRLGGTRARVPGELLPEAPWPKRPWLATLRRNVFRPAEGQPGKTATVERPGGSLPEGVLKLVERREEVSTGLPELTEAEIVISGGRGMKGPENYVILENMA